MFKPNKNQILVGVAVLAVVITAVLVSVNAHGGGDSVLSFFKLNMGSSPDAIAKQSVAYLNKSVLQSGQTATLISDKEQSGVVEMTISVAGTTYQSYATLDGKLLFPEAFTLGSTTTTTPTAATTPNTTTAAITPTNVPKVANTMLTAYVVSSCPFGIQIQRALSDAIKNIPTLANYVTVRYIGAVSGNTITSMHGTEEAAENLRQICIRDEQPTVYWNYVSCYIKQATGTASNGMPYGDSQTCQAQTGVDSAKLNACVADPNRGLADAKADFALDTKYNVTGSPTLILNGTTIDETAFGGRSSDGMKSIICDSLKNPPSFCSTKLNTTPATTSFSLTYAGATGTATTTNTACAPAT